MKRKFIIMLFMLVFIISGCGKKEENIIEDKKEEPIKEVKKLKIFDEDSDSRPYAIMINNYPSAMRVQTGLNDAYMIYEFPIEGGMSRSLAFFKDKDTKQIGTVRSARQYHPYFALEHDAIYVHWGTNHPAADVIKKIKIDNIDANSNSKPFFRDNPEKLATEHTGYTSLEKLKDFAVNTKKYRTTTDVKPPLKYSIEEIDLSINEDAKVANTIELNYSNSYKLKYTYNSETKRYERSYNNKEHKDYYTGEKFDTKNLIVAFVKVGSLSGAVDAAGTSYLDMTVTGSGKGYYITNGYAREITWNKEKESSQTVYKYSDGTEIIVNDGNTYLNFFNQAKSILIN